MKTMFLKQLILVDTSRGHKTQPSSGAYMTEFFVKKNSTKQLRNILLRLVDILVLKVVSNL